MADHRPRREYLPRQVQKDPEIVTNDDEHTRRGFIIRELLSKYKCIRVLVVGLMD